MQQTVAAGVYVYFTQSSTPTGGPGELKPAASAGQPAAPNTQKKPTTEKPRVEEKYGISSEAAGGG